MTEIPEHLLARSKARRSGGAAPAGDTAPAKAAESAAATKSAAAPAAAAAAAPAPKKEEPKLPWVEAAKSRRKIPVWAVSALALLPIWAVVYATTNDPQSPKSAGPLTVGAAKYATCAGCHGSTGAGAGATPALTTVDEVFPDPADHIRWVMLGTAGYTAEGKTTYGAENKPVGGAGNMPSQITLDSAELLSIIKYERESLAGETFDAAAWSAAVETLVNDENPEVADKAAEFGAIVDSWAALPPSS
ncbi:MAG: cytochrome c [Actinobacteria bacterium]|nr:cytochrome c [Actinomycetota bacterium]